MEFNSLKGFNMSLRVVMVLVAGLIAAAVIISLLTGNTDGLTQLSNSSTSSGGFVENGSVF